MKRKYSKRKKYTKHKYSKRKKYTKRRKSHKRKTKKMRGGFGMSKSSRFGTGTDNIAAGKAEIQKRSGHTVGRNVEPTVRKNPYTNVQSSGYGQRSAREKGLAKADATIAKAGTGFKRTYKPEISREEVASRLAKAKAALASTE